MQYYICSALFLDIIISTCFNSFPHNIYSCITSLFVSPWLILLALILKLTNSFPSLDIKYGSGPDFEPCFTLPASLSFNVVFGTLYSFSVALLTPILHFYGFHWFIYGAVIPLFMLLLIFSTCFLSLLFHFFHPFLEAYALLRLGIINNQVLRKIKLRLKVTSKTVHI